MRGKPFQLGNKYGCGRPPGSRNKVAGVLQDTLEEHAEILIKKCVHMALQGNTTAMRLCMEQLTPTRRQRVVRFKMPSIRTMAGVDAASEAVVKGVARGQITPGEGEAFTGMLEGRRKIIETEQFEARLKALEEAQHRPSAESGTEDSESRLEDLNELHRQKALISLLDSQALQAKSEKGEWRLKEEESVSGPIAIQNEREKKPEDLKELPLPKASLSLNDSQASQAKPEKGETRPQGLESASGPVAIQNDGEEERNEQEL